MATSFDAIDEKAVLQTVVMARSREYEKTSSLNNSEKQRLFSHFK